MSLLSRTLIGVGLSALLIASAHAETVLRLSTQMPPGHHSVKALEAFKAEVKDKTAGAVVIQIHPSGSLFKGPELPMAVGSGAIEMGDMVTPYIAPIYPELELLDGPFMVDSPELAKKLFSEDLAGPLNARFDRLGMKIVAMHPYGYFSMYGTNVHPIEKPEDMKGLTIRALEKTQILKAQAVGAKPEAIPGSEQFVAYQKGTVSIGQTGPSSFVSRKLYEMFKYGTIVRDDLMVFFLAINKKTWNKLTPEQQAIVETAGANLSKTSWAAMEAEERQADEFLPKHMKVIISTGENKKAWQKVYAPINETLAKDAGSAGQEIYKIIQDARTKLGVN